MDEPVRPPAPPAPTIKQALGVIAATAVVQARDLVVARLDHWAEEIRHGIDDPEVTATATPDDTAPSLPASLLSTPVLVGAVAGATVAWLLAHRPSQS